MGYCGWPVPVALPADLKGGCHEAGFLHELHNRLRADARFCENCGTRLKTDPQPRTSEAIRERSLCPPAGPGARPPQGQGNQFRPERNLCSVPGGLEPPRRLFPDELGYGYGLMLVRLESHREWIPQQSSITGSGRTLSEQPGRLLSSWDSHTSRIHWNWVLVACTF